jgi:(2R)-ethylmalonyl-CoA mutase
MRDKTQRDKPWIFRTYAGHSTARDSNELYRKNLAKGQTGLSVAFDLQLFRSFPRTRESSVTC